MYKMERTDNYLMFLDNDTMIEPYISYMDAPTTPYTTKTEPVKTQPTPIKIPSYLQYILLGGLILFLIQNK